jgi:hypothetical protein
MKRILTSILILLGLTGCASNIQEKHLELMKTHKDKVYFSTAAPFTFSNDKNQSYRWACFRYANEPAYWLEAKPTNHYHAYGGRSSEELEAYAMQECEKKFGRSCVVLLTNGYERCAATFDVAYARALARDEERENLVEKKKQEVESRKAEAMRSTCVAFGFSPNTPQMSTCVMELYKTTAQVEAIRTAAETQAQATNTAAEETARLLQFQQAMELLKQSNQILNPTQQNRMTTNCRYNTIMKTISCN